MPPSRSKKVCINQKVIFLGRTNCERAKKWKCYDGDKKWLPLTLDVEVDDVGHALAHGVGGLAGVEAGVVCGEALQHEAPVPHDEPLPHILPQLCALEHEIVLLDNCRIMLHRIS